jgi:hypothetical protein
MLKTLPLPVARVCSALFFALSLSARIRLFGKVVNSGYQNSGDSPLGD